LELPIDDNPRRSVSSPSSPTLEIPIDDKLKIEDKMRRTVPITPDPPPESEAVRQPTDK
jgi:hypothetical protein